MFDDVASIFYNSVVSAYDGYVIHRNADAAGRDRHLASAIEAATALFHFREHLPADRAMSRGQVERECPGYKLVGDVVNATKHGLLTNPRDKPIVKSAKDVEEMTIITSYSDEQGAYMDVRTIVQVRCIDNVTRNLDVALTNVLNFWGGKLKEWGIAPYSPASMPEAPGTRYRRRDECAGLFTLEILKGLRFKQGLQFLEFKPEKGKAEPVDLTGSTLTARVYKPASEFEVELIRPGSDETVQATLTLSDDESVHHHLLKTDDEKQAYLEQLVKSRITDLEWVVSAPTDETTIA